jgi:hypothetical protein
MGIECTLITGTDSSAAKGITARLGSGRVRHLEIRSLWVQDKCADKSLSIIKIGTAENRADIQTQYLDAKRHTQLVEALPVRRIATGCSASHKVSVIFVSMMCTANGEKVGNEEDGFFSFLLMIGFVWTVGVVFGIWMGSRLSKWAFVQTRRSTSVQTVAREMPEYWIWPATVLITECRRQRIYEGQLKADMIKDLVRSHGENTLH